MTTEVPGERMSSRSIVVGQFVLVLTSLAIAIFLSKFIGSVSDLLLLILGLPVAGASALIVVVWALWNPRGTKWRVMLVLFSVAALQVLATPWISRAGDRLFFETRRAELDAFAREIIAYGRIHQMSDGTRYVKELNNQRVAYSASDLETTTRDPNVQQALPVAEVLARDSVDGKRYEEFRSRLKNLKFIQFDVQPDYVAFLYDGFLDNLQGYLIVRSGGKPPALHSEMFRSDLVLLREVGGPWYWFATT